MATLVALALLVAGSDRGYAQERDGAPDLEWLAGCWEMRDAAMIVQEHWLSPRGGELLGVSRTIRRDSMVAYEFLRI